MQNFIPEEEIRRDQKIVDDGFYSEAYRRETQPIVIKREIGQKYGLEPKQWSKSESIARAILVYLRTIRNQKTSFTREDIQDFYKLTNYLGSYDKLKPFLELESKSFIEFLLKQEYDYILTKYFIKRYTLDNIDKITINRDITNGSSAVKFQLERYKAIKKYFDETYGIKQNVAKETNKSKYDLEVLFSEETYEIREQLEEILEDFINMCYDTYVYSSPTHIKILQLSKKYYQLCHGKYPSYNPHHIQDEEELRYIKYRNALYPTTVLYNHFQDINKKEERIEYSIKYFNKQFNDLINKKIIRTLLDKDANIDEVNVSELKKADFGYYFIINYGKGKLYANFLIQPESLDVSDMDEYVRTAYHLFPEHIHGEAVNYIMKVSVRPLIKNLNEGFDFNQINLTLDDFDDADQVQNIKSNQVQNRDYTKEYLDLVKNEVVDLGLPSGTLWCRYNLGVNPTRLLVPEDWYGNYYAWGELEQNKTKPYWDNYKFGNSFNELTKYCSNSEYGLNGFTDNLTQLLPEDDAVYQNKKFLNFKFHIPTKEQCEELLKYTKNYLVNNYDPNKIKHNPKNDKGINGLNGMIFEGKNGNQLFIPAAGYHSGSGIYNEHTYFYLWSSTLRLDFPYHAYSLYIGSTGIEVNSSSRYIGYSIRPVINL